MSFINGLEKADGPTLAAKFQASVEIVQLLPRDGPLQISTSDKLAFYSLFKQASIGICNVPRPSFWNVVEIHKWNAWKSLGDMSSVNAQELYVNKLKAFVQQAFTEYGTDALFRGTAKNYQKIIRSKLAIIGIEIPNNGVSEIAVSRLSDGNENYNNHNTSSHTKSCVKKSELEERKPHEACSTNDKNSYGCESNESPQLSSCHQSDEDFVDAEDAVPSAQVGEVRKVKSSPNRKMRSKEVRSGSETESFNSIYHQCILLMSQQMNAIANHLSTLLRAIKAQQQLMSTVISRNFPEVHSVLCSWRMFIFLLLWPFVVNILMRYLPFWR
ncbi:hypothetical protein AB6A40_009679 [Gnathostoma spinigerum]|uniref:ACB domain-containing protein n=1 Tax=Gnathostoma spinigerum TaxID=75299 RepID=A0ABD6ESM9_9BILA